MNISFAQACVLLDNFDMSNLNLNQNDILQYVDIGLYVLLGVFFGGMLLAFFRGLFRGWKQGTYRLIFLGLIAGGLLFGIPLWVDILGNFNLTAFLQSTYTITMDGKSATFQVGTTFETLRNGIYAVLHDIFGVRASPDAIANYAIALAGSIIRLVIVFLVAIFTETIGSLLVWILWHLIFKRFSSVEHRKPKARVISGLEDAIVWFSLLALSIVPFSGLLNTMHNNGDLPPDEGDETVQLINKIIDTYDKSIFNKLFFEWTKGDGGETIDTQIAEFFADNTYTYNQADIHANVVTEFRVFSKLEGSLVQWMYAEDPNNSLSGSIINTAIAIGEVLYSFADTQNLNTALNGVVPLTLDVARNIDFIMKDNAELMPNASPLALKKAYRDVAQSEYVLAAQDIFQGETFVPMYDSLCDYDALTLDLVRAEIDAEPAKKEAVNEIVSGYVLDQIEANPLFEESDALVGLCDLLPKKQGVYDESLIREIDWWKEANIFYNAATGVNKIADDSAPTSSNPSSLNNLLETYEPIFLNALARDPYGLIEILIGQRDEAGEPIVDAKGNNVSGLCLLDSDLLANMLPVALEVGGYVIDEKVIQGDRDLSVADELATLSEEFSGSGTKDIRTNFKREFGHILDVPGKMAQTDYGKNFIKNFRQHPGIDFAEDGTMIGISPEIAGTLRVGITEIDKSKFFNAVVPTIADHFVTPMLEPDKALGSFGITKIALYEDEEGNPIQYGKEISDVLELGVYCNDIIPIVGGMLGQSETGASVDPMAMLRSLMDLENEQNNYQLTHLLDIVSRSKILNPAVVDGDNIVRNTNIVGVLNSLFDRLPEDVANGLSIEIDDVSGLVLTSQWDGATLKEENRGENYYILQVMSTIVDSGLLDKIDVLQGGDTNATVRALSTLHVDEIFASVGHSSIMRKVASGLFDNLLLTKVIDPKDELHAEALGVTYKNLLTAEDWANEGLAMQNILDLATKGLDISQLDVTNPSVIKLLKRLSQSGMFWSAFDEDGALRPADEEGKVEKVYVFHKFILDKLLLTLDKQDMLKLFVDYPDLTIELDGVTDTIKNHVKSRENWSGLLDVKKELCTVFSRSIMLLDSPQEWESEFDILGSALNSLSALGGLDQIQNMKAEDLPAISAALDTLSDSVAFGPVLMGNALATALESNAMPEQLRGTELNTGWMFRNGRDYVEALEDQAAQSQIDAIVNARKAEVGALLNLLDLAGEEGALDINLKTLNVDAFLRPVLETCYNSKILNPTAQADMYSTDFPVPDVTGFESIILTIMEKAGVYLDEDGQKVTSRDVPVQGSTLTMTGIVNSVTDWDAESEAICEMIITLQNSSFVDDEGNFDMSPISGDLANYFARSGSRQELRYMLSMLEQSEVFYRCLPPQLSEAINGGLGNLPDNLVKDIKCADFFYTQWNDGSFIDFKPYNQDEVDRLIDILSNLAPLVGADLDNVAVLDIDSLSNALSAMGQSSIFNKNISKSATVFNDGFHDEMTCFQLFVSDMVLVDKLSDYYFLTDSVTHLPVSPKDIANAANYGTAESKAAHEVKNLVPAINAEETNRAAIATAVNTYVAGEWVDCLRQMQSTSFEGFFNGTQEFEDLTEDNLATLLHALNDCTLYRDCVPNGLYDALVNGDALNDLPDNVHLDQADFYFSYYLHDGAGHFSTTRNAQPDFSMPFYRPEIDQIAMLYSLLKEESGLVGDDVKIGNINAFSIRGVLYDLHDSFVFHLADQEEYNADGNPTVFQQFISVFLDKSKVYDKAMDGDKVSGTDLTLDDIVLGIPETGATMNWSTEIEHTYELVVQIQNSPAFLDEQGDFELAIDDFDDFFNGPEGVENKSQLKALLKKVEAAELFYRSLPSQLDDAVSNAVSDEPGIKHNLKMDLECANFLYSRSQRAELGGKYDIDPYTDQECDDLVDLMADMSSMTDFDTSDLSTLDSAKMVSAMERIGRSPIFNTDVTKSVTKFESEHQERMGMTANQALLCDVILVDSLDQYYYLGVNSEKDADLKTHHDIDNADQKVAYNVRNLCKPLTNTYTAADYEHDSFAYLQEWGDCLESLKECTEIDPVFDKFIKGEPGGNMADLQESTLKTLLHSLNDTTFYFDCVPNALYKILVTEDSLGDLTTSGVDLDNADFFHSYHYHNGTGAFSPIYTASPDFEMAYQDGEIDRICELYSTLKDDTTLASDPNFRNLDTAKMDSALRLAHQTYLFHKGNFERLNAEKDLSVFQQIMRAFLDNGGLYGESFEDAPRADSKTYVRETDFCLDDIVLNVPDARWEADGGEIENTIEIIETVRESDGTDHSLLSDDGRISFDKLSDLEAFFADPAAEPFLTDLLQSIEHGEIFYRCLPERLSKSTTDAFDDSTEPLKINLKKDLECADYYYGAFTHDGDLMDGKLDFVPYTDEEIEGMVTIFSSLSSMTDIDFSDISDLDTVKLTNAMELMGQNKIYNSNTVKSVTKFSGDLVKRQGLTSHQAVLCDVLLVDALVEHYYLAVSEKDMAFAGEYSSAKEKIAYNIRLLSKPLTNTYDATQYAADSFGYFEEWKACLDTLKDPAFHDFINGNSTVGDQSQASLTTMLKTLNDTTFYFDCVPNALYNAIVTDGGIGNVDSSDVNMEDAAYFHSYHFYDPATEEFATAYRATPNFSMRYQDEEIDRITALYWKLKDDNSLTDNPKVGTIDADNVNDILTSVHETYLFHKGNYVVRAPLHELTVFEQIVRTFVHKSGVYDADALNLDETIKGTQVKLDDVILLVPELDWEDEIDHITDILEKIQDSPFTTLSGDLDFSPLSDLNAFFAVTGNKAKLNAVLASIEDSEVFYRCLPSRLEKSSLDAFDGSSGIVPAIKKDLQCADYYYTQFVHAVDLAEGKIDFSAYSDDDTEKLVDIFELMASMTDVDLTKINLLDTDKLTSALKLMGQHMIYNSNVAKSSSVFEAATLRQGMTAHQALLCDVFLVDALKPYYFLAESEKDIAFAGEYTNADQKIAYNVSALSLPLSASQNATQYEANTASLFADWKDCLDDLSAGPMDDFVSGAKTADNLESDDLKSLLGSLNKTEVYFDCVPNALYDTIVTKNAMGIPDIDFESTDVYFSYHYYTNASGDAESFDGNYKFSTAFHTEPKFSMPFNNNELEHICDLYGDIKANKDSLNSLSLNSPGLDVFLRDSLTALWDSYMFHEGRVSHRRASSFLVIDDVKDYTAFTDLTVFEQFMYKLYHDTSLMDANYSPLKDFSYGVNHPDDASKYKMHDKILAYTANPSSDWTKQINALTTDGRARTETFEEVDIDADPYIGLINAGNVAGIFDDSSEVGVSFTALNTISPKQIKTLLYAINENSILSDVLPNSVGDLLGTNSAGDGIGLSKFSSVTHGYSIGAGSTSFNIANHPELFYEGNAANGFAGADVLHAGVSGDPAGKYEIHLNDDASTDITDLVTVTYADNTANFYVTGLTQDFTITLNSGLTFTGGVLVDVDGSNFDLDYNAYRNVGVKAIGYLLSSAYRGAVSGGVYFSFAGSSDVTLDSFYNDASSNFKHSTYGMLNLFLSSGFYTEKFTEAGIPTLLSVDSHSAGALALYNALEFTIDTTVDISFEIAPSTFLTLPSSTTISIGKYIGEGTTKFEHLQAIDTMTSGYTIYNYVQEAYWLDHSASQAGTFDVYDDYQHHALSDTEISSVAMTDYYRFALSSYIDWAFATNDSAMDAIEAAFDSLAFVEHTFDVPLHQTGEPGSYVDTVKTVSIDGEHTVVAKSIIANLIASAEQNKADFIDLEHETITVQGGGNSKRYTRIGDPALHVSEEAALRTAGLTYADDYAGLTTTLRGSAKNAFKAMRFVNKGSTGIFTPYALTDEDKDSLRAAFNGMTQTDKFTNLFYLASIYDRMVPLTASGLYTFVPETDVAFVNASGVIHGSAMPFTYANIASSF